MKVLATTLVRCVITGRVSVHVPPVNGTAGELYREG